MNNENSQERLDRIEKILDRLTAESEATKAELKETIAGLKETRAIANSNSRAIQAMLEQQATERLKHEEAMGEMRGLMARIAETQSGLTKIPINHDEDRPTILRRLMAIENKVDTLIERTED